MIDVLALGAAVSNFIAVEGIRVSDCDAAGVIHVTKGFRAGVTRPIER
jgi:hypothetical protein